MSSYGFPMNNLRGRVMGFDPSQFPAAMPGQINLPPGAMPLGMPPGAQPGVPGGGMVAGMSAQPPQNIFAQRAGMMPPSNNMQFRAPGLEGQPMPVPGGPGMVPGMMPERLMPVGMPPVAGGAGMWPGRGITPQPQPQPGQFVGDPRMQNFATRRAMMA